MNNEQDNAMSKFINLVMTNDCDDDDDEDDKIEFERKLKDAKKEMIKEDRKIIRFLQEKVFMTYDKDDKLVPFCFSDLFPTEPKTILNDIVE